MIESPDDDLFRHGNSIALLPLSAGDAAPVHLRGSDPRLKLHDSDVSELHDIGVALQADGAVTHEVGR